MQPEKPSHRKNRLFIWSLANLTLLCTIAGVEYFGDLRFWPVALLFFAPQHIFVVPTAVLLFLCIRRRQPKCIAANFLALFILLFYFLGFNIPFNSNKISSGKQFRVMTYNIRYGSLGTQEIAKIIQNENPDILYLQEVLTKDHWPDPLPALKKEFPAYFSARYGELVIFSRWPVSGQKIHRLPDRNGSGVLETKVALGGQTLTLFNVHFINPVDSRTSEWPSQIRTRAVVRNQQFALLHRLVQKQQTSYLIAGDFNTPSRGHLRNQFSGLGTDVWKSSGWGFGNSFPASFPVMRIDYLRASEDLHPLSSRIVASRASDHRPLVAELVLDVDT